MKFILAKSLDNKYFRLMDSSGEIINIESYNINRVNNICAFDYNKLAEVDMYSNKIKKYSSVITNKFIDDNKIFFIGYNANGDQTVYTRDDILDNKFLFSNIIITSDRKIKYIRGKIPVLSKEIYENNTVVKIKDLYLKSESPMGLAKKFIGQRKSDRSLGVVKFPILGNFNDIKNEVVYYRLGKLLGYNVCEASIENYLGNECVISLYDKNFYNGALKHLKSCIRTHEFRRTFNKKWVITNFSKSAWINFIKMLIIDIITCQVDRHINNIAFINDDMYPLFDNGRCLFFDNLSYKKKSLNLKNVSDIRDTLFINEHGYGMMYLEDVLGYNNYISCIKINLKYKDFLSCLKGLYKKSDALFLARYMYNMYCILIRRKLNE